jgi:hypothetical protein
VARALKVYRTAIGFHDAYVAAPSMKAALRAWGTDKDLFARKAAELIEDPRLTAEPLAHPGEVIRKLRGSASEHVQALGKIARPKPTKKMRAEPAAKPSPRAKRKRPPKPSDEALKLARDAAAASERRARERLAELAEREKALAAERTRVERELAAEARRHAERLAEAEDEYAAAMRAWREG